ncbi:unnamed protein product [Staurois parvus]|uniref:Uncharacterized protein n=1 Tax=Staurois parvus TaxID=386267 RepID=A0ABN9CDE1_9NEOB|nr:unnamed protein product [Staurois parvus]
MGPCTASPARFIANLPWPLSGPYTVGGVSFCDRVLYGLPCCCLHRHPRPVPCLCSRADGFPLFYPGRLVVDCTEE